MQVLKTNHESVLAFVRHYDGDQTRFGDSPESVLCIFSFAHSPVSAEVQVTGFEGSTTFDLFGGAEFPAIGGDGTLTVTLGTQGFYWLHLGDAPRGANA
jgi:maltose alpha-D-glucosyltransferase/alpha-amylase